MNNDRNAAVGDMIIHTPRVRNNNNVDEPSNWIGIVHRIKKDEWGHGTAFVTWTRENPYYHDKWGVPCVNFHNFRREYEVVKRK